MQRLDGKVVVITGAASGIGRDAVDLFVSEGAYVVAADIQSDKGRSIEEEYREKARYVHCNVMQESDIAAAVAAAIKHFGKLDCFFSNAGTNSRNEPADNITAEGFDDAMHMHVRAALFGLKYSVPAMKKSGGGSFISTSSAAGVRPGYGPVLYSIAKAAIRHMTAVAAAELGPSRVRVNCICPGMVATNIFAHGVGLSEEITPAILDAMVAATKDVQPIPRGGRPRDIAEAALYLASDGAEWVTGQTLVVDGGWTLGPSPAVQKATITPILRALGLDPDTWTPPSNP